MDPCRDVYVAFLCPHSDMRKISVEENSQKGKIMNKVVSSCVSLLRPGVRTCSVTHESTDF